MKQIVIFAIMKNNKILVEKRGSKSHWAGELLLPGGVVEENESLEVRGRFCMDGSGGRRCFVRRGSEDVAG